jgi:hypothetical protein
MSRSVQAAPVHQPTRTHPTAATASFHPSHQQVVVGVVTATQTAPLVVPVAVVDRVQPLAHQPAAQGPQAKATPVATCPQRQAHLRPVVVVQAQSVPTQPLTSPVTVAQAFPPPSTAQPHSVPVAVAVGHPTAVGAGGNGGGGTGSTTAGGAATANTGGGGGGGRTSGGNGGSGIVIVRYLL